jgi:hypothetical protein
MLIRNPHRPLNPPDAPAADPHLSMLGPRQPVRDVPGDPVPLFDPTHHHP